MRGPIMYVAFYIDTQLLIVLRTPDQAIDLATYLPGMWSLC